MQNDYFRMMITISEEKKKHEFVIDNIILTTFSFIYNFCNPTKGNAWAEVCNATYMKSPICRSNAHVHQEILLKLKLPILYFFLIF